MVDIDEIKKRLFFVLNYIGTYIPETKDEEYLAKVIMEDTEDIKHLLDLLEEAIKVLQILDEAYDETIIKRFLKKIKE